MANHKKKATLQAVLAEIAPYVTKHFMAKPTVHEQDIEVICRLLLPKYSNVKLLEGTEAGKPYLKIQVKGLFLTEEKILEIQTGTQKKKKPQGQDLSWIDALECMDAALDDR